MAYSLDSSHPVEALLLAPISTDVQERLRRIRLMAFDVDGVLTDGRLWYNEHGEAHKAFYALDGHGLRLLQESGIQVALLTARSGPIVARRSAELGIAEVHQGARNKAAAIQEIAQRLGLELSEIGFMGDDLIDLAALQRVGFAASVPNAPRYVSQVTHWVSSQRGGLGAARECCDLILASQGKLGQFFYGEPITTVGAIQ